MKKITHKTLSIPPYISTAWKNINTLHMREVFGRRVLVVVLHNGAVIELPWLEEALIKEIFSTHAHYMDQEAKEGTVRPSKTGEGQEREGSVSFAFGVPLQVQGQVQGVEGVEEMQALFQHSPERAHSPPLPQEVLAKITAITKALGMQLGQPGQLQVPQGEPHCNCPHCQIARAMRGETQMFAASEEEEIVTSEELHFRDWDIRQEGEKLYVVSNPLDTSEHYQVFLGSPVGCTCGEKNCEHIRTVLNS